MMETSRYHSAMMEYIHIYIYIHTYIQTDRQTYIQTDIHTYIHTYIHREREILCGYIYISYTTVCNVEHENELPMKENDIDIH